MVYTVTVNPSLDYYISAEGIIPGAVNRVSRAEFAPGGKGINVSLACKSLGVRSVCLTFAGGFVGAALLDMLAARGLDTDFITVEGNTRVNVKAASVSGEDVEITEYNTPTPPVPDCALDALISRLRRAGEGDMIVLSGSDPQGVYDRILESLPLSPAVIVDTSGAGLITAAKRGVQLLKPNEQELAELFGPSEDVICGAKRLVTLGARCVIVSRGGDGATLVTADEIISCPAARGRVLNTVGCGDSMIAGYIYASLRGADMSTRLRCAVSAGSATAFSPPGSLCPADLFHELMRR